MAESVLMPLPLPTGLRSRMVPNINGLTMHVLEAGERRSDSRLLLLLHGFPELAYSWRKLMPLLAAAGYHVVAPDQRGYGRTLGWDARYDGDWRSFSMPRLAEDAVALVRALGYERAEAVIGHDFGSPVAAWSALLYPQVFRAATLMSAPFGGPPLPVTAPASASRLHDDLAALPRPRKHYQWYYSTSSANQDMWLAAPQLQQFVRDYYHVKSADWAGNRAPAGPLTLQAWTAQELARLPTYYVMDAAATMPETVAVHRPSQQQTAACSWLTEAELAVYVQEYSRTGFQGGLNWYRCATDPQCIDALRQFQGRQITVPLIFIGGVSDWGVVQKPGELVRMQTQACAQFRGLHLIPDAGHWVQQEQAQAVAKPLVEFLAQLAA